MDLGTIRASELLAALISDRPLYGYPPGSRHRRLPEWQGGRTWRPQLRVRKKYRGRYLTALSTVIQTLSTKISDTACKVL